MKRHKKILLNGILCLTFFMIVFWHSAMDVFAINTKFCVPTISNQFTPDNVIYKSPNLNIQAEKWSYGLSANILNTSNVGSLLAELHANVSPSGYSKAILGIYMEGAGLSDSDAAAIAGAGWTDIELYYDTFFVGGCAPSGAMTPYVGKVGAENAAAANAAAILETASITENIAMVEVSGVNMARVNYILYEPEFKFLNGKNLYSYKYIADLGVFVAVPETYFGSYDANFLEFFDLQLAEADANGLYVTLTQSLPEDIVVSADQVPVLRANPPATPPNTPSTGNSTENPALNSSGVTNDGTSTESTKETSTGTSNETSTETSDETTTETSAGKEPTNSDALVISNTEDTVEWTFTGGQSPANFTAEATIEVINETEISVDFAYSGELPQGTEVTVQIPTDKVEYQEGDTLYFYYCNPETNQRDFVSEGTYQESQVTFQINHCSEYVISTIAPDAAENTSHGNTIWILFAAISVAVCGTVAGIVVFKKKK